MPKDFSYTPSSESVFLYIYVCGALTCFICSLTKFVIVFFIILYYSSYSSYSSSQGMVGG